jgi:hypothetical protein
MKDSQLKRPGRILSGSRLESSLAAIVRDCLPTPVGSLLGRRQLLRPPSCQSRLPHPWKFCTDSLMKAGMKRYDWVQITKNFRMILRPALETIHGLPAEDEKVWCHLNLFGPNTTIPIAKRWGCQLVLVTLGDRAKPLEPSHTSLSCPAPCLDYPVGKGMLTNHPNLHCCGARLAFLSRRNISQSRLPALRK